MTAPAINVHHNTKLFNGVKNPWIEEEHEKGSTVKKLFAEMSLGVLGLVSAIKPDKNGLIFLPVGRDLDYLSVLPTHASLAYS